MTSAPIRQGFRSNQVWSRQRAAALALTVLLHLIVVAVLLLYRFPLAPLRVEERLTAFSLNAAPDKAPEKKKAPAPRQRARAASVAPVSTPPPPPAPTPEIPQQTPSFLNLSPQDFAASDIGKQPSQKQGGAQSAGSSAAVAGPGEGPGGVRLYNAEWYRRPTGAELAGYLPANAPRPGYGLVACRTIEGNRVENCQSLGESPLGSGYARAVRMAAWQFRVVPPRVDGRPLIGAWVRIRIDYLESGASAG